MNGVVRMTIAVMNRQYMVKILCLSTNLAKNARYESLTQHMLRKQVTAKL